jgi:hypothetical protein
MMTHPTIEDLTIREEELGQSRSIYVARVAQLLPNFPNDVLETWLCEHPESMKQSFPLGFGNFRFEKVQRTTVELGGAAIFRKGTSLAKLRDDMRITHLRLQRYWDDHGDFPSPPILIDTSASAIPAAFPHPLQEPIHLLEGYHRVALAINADAVAAAPIARTYWLVRILDPNAGTPGPGTTGAPDSPVEG